MYTIDSHYDASWGKLWLWEIYIFKFHCCLIRIQNKYAINKCNF